MTKEPNKDFGEAVRDLVWFAWADEKTVDEATTRILALCKEMLVPGTARGFSGRFATDEVAKGWNACRSELLKQLGEK